MPRRIPDYALQFAEFNTISTVGAFILGIRQLLFAWNIWSCVRAARRPTARVWEGAEGLEWELSSPPPHHSWETQPVSQVSDASLSEPFSGDDLARRRAASRGWLVHRRAVLALYIIGLFFKR